MQKHVLNISKVDKKSIGKTDILWATSFCYTLKLQGSHYKKETMYQRKGAYSMQLIMFN